MKIKDLIEYGKKLLNKNEIEDSNIISRELAQYILQLNRQEIIINIEKEVEEKQKDRYYLALIEIIQGMPIQYITNSQEFMGYNFYVDENVLIPQPDTEVLVEQVIKVAQNKEKVKILDICTGSGCIGISLAKKIENAQVTLSDISAKALEVAKKNAILNDVNVDFIISDMFKNIFDKYDIIVSNPPYIETNIIKTLGKDVQNEPYIALDGGQDGLDFYKILINEATNYLSNRGFLCMEIGYDQKEKVIELAKQKGEFIKIESIKDLAGNDRVVILKMKE